MGIPETLPALAKEDLESQPATARYEYDPWLLDDHPLRSHPTECIPDLAQFFGEWWTSLRLRWKETLILAGCLLLACLAAFQCFKSLLSPHNGQSLPHPPVMSRVSRREWHVRCTYPHSDPRPNALAQSVDAGCDGLRTEIWLRGNELQMGLSNLGPSVPNTLPLRLDSIIAKLELESAFRSSQFPLIAGVGGLSHNDPTRTFMLVLDAGSSLPEVFPALVSQLEVFRQRDYLSHWNGAGVVQRAITVVVTGESLSRSDCEGSPYSDIFWSAGEGFIFAEDFAHSQLSPICVA